MKVLIDECLSPELATLARGRGHPESTHVTWLGLAGRKDRVCLQPELQQPAAFAGWLRS